MIEDSPNLLNETSEISADSEVSHGLGEAALSPSESAMPLSTEGIVTDHNMAEEMALAEDPVRVIISNLDKSDLSEDTKKVVREKLEQDADELSNVAKEKYEANKKIYTDIRNDVIGSVTALLQEIIPKDNREIIDIWPRIDKDSGLLSATQILELRNLTYALLGAIPPEIVSIEDKPDYAGGWRPNAVGMRGEPLFRGNFYYDMESETPTEHGFSLNEELVLVKDTLDGIPEVGRVEITTHAVN